MKLGSWALLGLFGSALLGCSSAESDESTAESQAAIGAFRQGKKLFEEALPNTNGRACATCHVESDHTTLTRSGVAARYAANPHDPLFLPLDADDPAAASPTYAHLGAGLVRVTLPLADNLDVIDDAGNVITNAARTLWVWRGVPTIENTSYTAPYQLDGRIATLEEQALAALHAHSQITKDPSEEAIEKIANFERTVYSSPAAAIIALAIDLGQSPPNIQPHVTPGSAAAAGKALFQQACVACHGGAKTTDVTNMAAHDQAFPVLNPDGTVNIQILPDGTAVAVNVRHDVAGHQQLNIGTSFGTYLGQIGAVPNATGVDFPHYRLRFYTDASRTQKLMDLPPPFPGVGPTLAPQAFSTDPGRAVTTGDTADWEAFEIPQLRGISRTAPYFHDNSALDLMGMLDIYSRFILPAIPQLGLPRVVPPAAPGLPPESLTVQQKTQLIAYLNLL
jgi:hypothetical protein